jgi:hypothetical protein
VLAFVAAAGREGDIWGNLPWTVVLAVPIVLALAVVVGMVLGPLGESGQSRRRTGAVSRILSRGERTGNVES